MIWFLQNQLSKWTNLILADDLYTVFNCDFICVNENGQKKARIQCLVHSIQWFSMQYRWILCLLSLVSQWRLVSMAKYVMLASTRGSRTSPPGFLEFSGENTIFLLSLEKKIPLGPTCFKYYQLVQPHCEKYTRNHFTQGQESCEKNATLANLENPRFMCK